MRDLGPDCGGTFQHNGSPPGCYGALMYGSPDDSRPLPASVTAGDATIGPAQEFPKALDRLVKEVFRGGQAAG